MQTNVQIICCDFFGHSNGRNVIRWYLDDIHPKTRRTIVGAVTAVCSVEFNEEVLQTEFRVRLFGFVVDIDDVLGVLEVGNMGAFDEIKEWWAEGFLP